MHFMQRGAAAQNGRRSCPFRQQNRSQADLGLEAFLIVSCQLSCQCKVDLQAVAWMTALKCERSEVEAMEPELSKNSTALLSPLTMPRKASG